MLINVGVDAFRISEKLPKPYQRLIQDYKLYTNFKILEFICENFAKLKIVGFKKFSWQGKSPANFS